MLSKSSDMNTWWEIGCSKNGCVANNGIMGARMGASSYVEAAGEWME